MRKLTPYLLTCFAAFCIVFLPSKARASHAAGGEVIYEHISDSTYRFFFKFYRDCTGIPAPTTQDLCWYNTCNPSDQRDTTMQLWPGLIPPGVANGSSVSIGCSNASTTCDASPGPNAQPGFQEYWYYTIITLPYQCNAWKFSVSVSARNTATLNLSSPNLFYVETTFNNAYAQGNTSPYFSNKPIPYCCLNVPYTYNNGAVDPNPGDSLVSEMINPLDGGCYAPQNHALATTTPAISFPSNPMQTNNTFVLNPATGAMNFIPTQAGSHTLAIRTKEYRNGVLIGSIIRDVQVQVITPCSTVVPKPIKLPPGGINPLGQVQGCVNAPINFCFDVTTNDTAAVFIVSDNAPSSLGPGAVMTYTNQKTDSVRGCLNWTPTAAGLFNLSVLIRDSTCYPPGVSITTVQVVPILVYPHTVAYKDTSVCPGDPVQLSATGGGTAGTFQWAYVSGPTGSLSSTTGNTTVASPFATTSYSVTTTTSLPFCGDKARDTVTVTVKSGVNFTPIPDMTACPGVPVQLDLNIVPDPGSTYKITWTPATYLNNPAIEDPITTPMGDVTYKVVIESTTSSCKAYDTVKVDVLDGFLLQTPDTAICEGQSLKVRAVGDSRYTYAWTSNASAYNIDSPAVLAPTITPGTLGKHTYTVTASTTSLNCPDSSASFEIDLQPMPTVTLPGDTKMCYGDTMKIYATVTPANYPYSYSWAPGQALDNPNTKDPIFSGFNSETLTMTASSSAGCKDDDDISITVLPSDFMTVSNDTAICPNDTIQIHMTGVGLKSFYWNVTSNISSNTSNDPTVWPDGTTQYIVYGRDTNLCYDTQSLRVTVKPAAVIELPDSIQIYPGESYHMDPKGNALYYSWFPYVGLSDVNIADPIAKPEANTPYTVTATTEFGCSTTDVIRVMVMDDSRINMPNAFTPGTSKNATFKVVRIGEAKLKRFTIFNRWGVKMFETTDINQGWDGTYKGEPQPMGVYIYTIEAQTYSGRIFSQQGNVTLLR